MEVVLSTSTYDYFIKMMIGARPNILETGQYLHGAEFSRVQFRCGFSAAAAEPDPFDRSFSTRLDAFDDGGPPAFVWRLRF